MLTAPPNTTTLYTLVPHLLNLYPDWEESDLVEFIEERTGQPMCADDVQTTKALWQRFLTMRGEFDN